MTPKNYYFDMDGVLAVYDRNAYIGQNPIWLQKNQHYFKNCKPDVKMLDLAYKIYMHCCESDDNLYILTSLPVNGSIFNEQFHDKIQWIAKWMPYIDISHVLISVTSKRDAVEYINNHTLSVNDILIDDYNKNLTDWHNAGGTAIKYCNGINSPESFDGLKLFHNNTIDTMIDEIFSISL